MRDEEEDRSYRPGKPVLRSEEPPEQPEPPIMLPTKPDKTPAIQDPPIVPMREPPAKKTKETPQEVAIRLTNELRKKSGKPPLTMNEKLTRAAQLHAENIANKDILSHKLDDKEPWDRIADAGYESEQSGENVVAVIRENYSPFPAQLASVATDAIAAFAKSEGHRRNMLRDNVTEIGIGLAYCGKEPGKWYVAQVLAKPK